MNQHDASYRGLFSDKLVVADLIRGFVRASWVNELDFETLERVSGSFVSDTFQRRENDVIWRVRFRGHWLYVYLLIEFQSTVERFMALRLMVYVGLLYQRLIDEKVIERGDLLPPVLPIVLYNGTERWWAQLDVAELIADSPDDLIRYRPQMRYFLLEEHATDDADLAGMENLAALVFRFEKCRTRKDFEMAIDALRGWASLPKHQESIRKLARWVELILCRDHLPERSVADLEKVQECGTMLEEQVKQWERELRTEAEAELLARQLETKFGLIPDTYRQLIGNADSEQILAWAKRILTAEQIEDVFE